MLIRKAPDFRYSEITPKQIYMNRRRFLATAAIGGGLAAVDARAANPYSGVVKSPLSTTEKPTPLNAVASYNNYYEFGTSKEEPAQRAKALKTSPWTVSIEGGAKPEKLDLESIMKLAPLEERIYRHRCVERWSIVVPWIGYSLSTIIKLVEPTSKAKYVAFQSFYDPKQMPESKYTGLDYPYVEGLRIDEAMHPLALLCVGMYGETLPNQDGAPVRMVIPWKYGYKSIKSIVKIRLQSSEPPTSWNRLGPSEYGFYSNVNPNVDHPRWSQATERRLGEVFLHKTLMFNGYSDQVASLYSGMDLKKFH